MPNKILAFLVAVVFGFLTSAVPAFATHRVQVLHRFSGNDGEFPYYGNLIFALISRLLRPAWPRSLRWFRKGARTLVIACIPTIKI